MTDDTSLLLVTFWPDSPYHDVFLVHAYHWAKVPTLPPCTIVTLRLDGEDDLQMPVKAFLQECHVCDLYDTVVHFQRKTGGVRHTGRFDAWSCLAFLLGLRIFSDTFFRADTEELPSDIELASIICDWDDDDDDE